MRPEGEGASGWPGSRPDADMAGMQYGLRGWHERNLIAGGTSLPLHMVEFDESRFSTDAFRVGGIALPAQIASSVRKRQAEFFFGRLAARRALARLGKASCEVPIGRSRAPVWPATVIGSISHSGHFAAAVALAQDTYRGVGIDLEHVLGQDMLATVRSTVLDDREYALLAESSGDFSIETWSTLVFSAKESFFKGCFGRVGRYFDFRAVRVVRCDAQSRSLQLEVMQPLCDELVAGQVFDVRFEFLLPETVLTWFIW